MNATPERRATIVVGVTSAQSPTVVEQALVFARRFDADLVCVAVDPARFVVDTRADGIVVAAPFDPDGGDAVDEVIDPEIVERVSAAAARAGVHCRFVATAGDPARQLGRIADDVDAALIVVGTRRPTLGGTVREFFSGSIAAGPAHRQRRPVVVVPLDPVASDTVLPWDESR